MLSLFISTGAVKAQERLETPIRLKIENGNTEQVAVVLKNLTTGETNSVNGESKFSLSLKLNCDYIISFSKPGYVTKKIQVNTTIPADRAKQGLYPFPFDVYLFKQYDGVNIVVFNQPVGKIGYKPAMDDFDYDTDYTKQIQSLIKEAEEQTKQKALAEEQKLKEEEKEQAALKAIADQEAREAIKLKAAEDKKALAAAKAAEEAQKKAEKIAYQERQKELKAQQEAEKQARIAALEAEEEKKKLQAKESAEARPSGNNNSGAENTAVRLNTGTGDDIPPANNSGSNQESMVVVSQAVTSEDPGPADGYIGSGQDEHIISMATANKFQESGQVKAKAFVFQDSHAATVPAISRQSLSAGAVTSASDVQSLPEVKVEEISELNRVITRVTVKKLDNAVVYRRVVYQWGGVYFFKNDRPISESLYMMATVQR